MVTGDLPDFFAQLGSIGARTDVKIRPVLLRVLVDMFVSKPHHREAELRQFEEMMAHLLDDADDETRLAVAAKLSLDPNTPASLLHRFVADRGAIAAKVLAQAPMAPASLQAAAVFGTEAMAAAVAGRIDLGTDVLRCLAERPEEAVVLALLRNRAATFDRSLLRLLARRAQKATKLAVALIERTSEATDAHALFLSAPPRTRAAMIMAARREDLGSSGRPPHGTAGPDALLTIECAALAEGLEGLDLALAVALGLTADEVLRLIEDPHGEPLALALAALGVSPEVAARIFIRGDPRIGHSFGQVKALVSLVENTSSRVAAKLVYAMLGRSVEPLRRPVSPAQVEPGARRQDHEPRRIEAAPSSVPFRHATRA